MRFIFPTIVSLDETNEENQVKQVKQCIQETKRLVNSHKSILCTDSLKTFFDLLEELEHGIYPSPNSLDLVTAAVKNEDSKLPLDMLSHVIRTKIFLFCKIMRYCLGEKEVQDVSKLPRGSKDLVGKTIKTKLKDLDYFAKIKNLVGPENQKIVDLIDSIKRASHIFLTKAEYHIADYTFQHEGHVYKVWRLMREIIPEGVEDKLEAASFTFEDNNGKAVTVKQSIFADHGGLWHFKLTVDKMIRNNSVSDGQPVRSYPRNAPNVVLILKPVDTYTKGDCSVFIPYTDYIKSHQGTYQWTFVANKIRNEQELIICSIFKGTISQENTRLSSPEVIARCPPVPVFPVAGYDLLKKARTLSYKEPRKHPSTISLAMGVLNFTEKKMMVRIPHLTSGTIHIKESKEDQIIQPYGAVVLFAGKTDFSLRGTVGVTVISIGDEGSMRNLALYWDVPYDRGLYENKFALVPLDSLEKVKSEEAYNCSAVQMAIASANKASEGPRSIQVGDYIVTVDLGGGYRTRMQVVVMNLHSIKDCSAYGI